MAIFKLRLRWLKEPHKLTSIPRKASVPLTMPVSLLQGPQLTGCWTPTLRLELARWVSVTRQSLEIASSAPPMLPYHQEQNPNLFSLQQRKDGSMPTGSRRTNNSSLGSLSKLLSSLMTPTANHQSPSMRITSHWSFCKGFITSLGSLWVPASILMNT